MASHQVAQFSTNSKAYHDAEFKKVSKYLLGSRDECLMSLSKEVKALEAFTDANFLVDLVRTTLKI